MTAARFRTFAWIVLGYAIAVIVWGAVVRATGSGAGCGAHWPLCNGEVVPIAPALGTVIEFMHRLTSGLILVLTVLLLWMAFKTFPAGHTARRAAAWSLVFVIVEALIGAGIVLLRLVEDNASALRAIYVAGHLANTLLLVGCYTWTAFAAGRPETHWAIRPADRWNRWERWLELCLIGLIATASAGAVVALGDTLFPARSLAEGFAADLDPTAHFLIRLRAWHPALAVVVSGVLVFIVTRSDMLDSATQRTSARWLLALIGIQVALGAANLFLLAPLALQMLHLLVSNLLWVAAVWLCLATRSARALQAS